MPLSFDGKFIPVRRWSTRRLDVDAKAGHDATTERYRLIAKAREIGADKELSESDELLRKLAKMKPKPRQKRHK
jgi:hypothetical protein